MEKENLRYRYNKSSIFQNSTSGIGNRVTGHKIDAKKKASHTQEKCTLTQNKTI